MSNVKIKFDEIFENDAINKIDDLRRKALMAEKAIKDFSAALIEAEKLFPGIFSSLNA